MKQDPKWKKFEKIIADIQQQLTPNAKVIHNYKIVGKRGRKRQIDVYVEQKKGFIPIITIIECKNRKRPIGVDDIEGFPLKMKEVGAHAGIVISTSGFREGVAEFAKENNFNLMEYRKAENTDWDELLGEQAWLNIVRPAGIYNAKFYLKIDTIKDIDEVNADIELFNSQNQSIGSLKERILNDLIYKNEQVAFLPAFRLQAQVQGWYINSKDDDFKKIDEIYMSGEIQHKVFTANLRLNDGEVISHTHTGAKEYVSLNSQWFAWQPVLEQQEGRLLSKEEYIKLQMQGTLSSIVDTSQLQPYLRVVFSKKPD